VKREGGSEREGGRKGWRGGINFEREE